MLNFFKRRRGEDDDEEASVATLAPPQPLYAMQEPQAPVARVSPYRQPELLDSGEPILPGKAYTHGFESIYALENVDASTVRPLGAAAAEETEPSRSAETVAPTKLKVLEKKKIPEFVEDQLRLDLGPEYRGWIEPFRLSEPVEVLGLSAVALKGLKSHGKLLLRDLLSLDRKMATCMKGLGQGHIDETIERLDAYLDGWPRQKAERADFSGLVLSVLGAAEHKAAHLCLSEYGLEDLIPLTAADQAELRHLNAAQRAELIDELKADLLSERTSRFVREKVKMLIEVFVQPWMRGRMGLARKRELYERLERIARDAERARTTLHFLTDLYYEKCSPFSQVLEEVEPGVFAADKATAYAYRRLKDCAQSYFYSSQLRYPLPELEGYIARECARRWEGYPDAFLVKVLRSSPSFRVRKGAEGYLTVRKAC